LVVRGVCCVCPWRPPGVALRPRGPSRIRGGAPAPAVRGRMGAVPRRGRRRPTGGGTGVPPNMGSRVVGRAIHDSIKGSWGHPNMFCRFRPFFRRWGNSCGRDEPGGVVTTKPQRLLSSPGAGMFCQYIGCALRDGHEDTIIRLRAHFTHINPDCSEAGGSVIKRVPFFEAKNMCLKKGSGRRSLRYYYTPRVEPNHSIAS